MAEGGDNLSISDELPAFSAEPPALDINAARTVHLATLGLDLDGKTVIDVGRGPAVLAQFFVQHGCDVLTVEARLKNPGEPDEPDEQYTGPRAAVVDVENDPLSPFGKFDVVSCYGLLHHLVRPEYVFDNLAQVCGGLMLIETNVLDEAEPLVEIVEDEAEPVDDVVEEEAEPIVEDVEDDPDAVVEILGDEARRVLDIIAEAAEPAVEAVEDEAQPAEEIVEDSPPIDEVLRDRGCRPSPTYVIQQLRRCGFNNVYVPRDPPEHEDFVFEYRNDRSHSRDGHLIRQLFIASVTKLESSALIEVSDGREFYGSDPLESLTLEELKELAKKQYKPAPLSTQNWYVGKTEATLPEDRLEMSRLWRVLRLKSTDRPQIAIDWYHGIHLKLALDDEIARCVFVEGIFEPNEFVLLDRYLQKGMTFIDAGANNGLYSVFAARKVGWRGRVLAFEPSAREFDKLKANVASNFLMRVSSHKKALGASMGEVELAVATLPYSGHNSLGHFGYETTRLERHETVPLTTVDAEVKSARLRRVDVIKADVEGAELALLQGAMETLKRFKPMVLVELSDRTLGMQGTNSGEVIDFLEGLGYELYEFDREGGLRPLERKDTFDGFNVVAVAGERSTAVLAAGSLQTPAELTP